MQIRIHTLFACTDAASYRVPSKLFGARVPMFIIPPVGLAFATFICLVPSSNFVRSQRLFPEQLICYIETGCIGSYYHVSIAKTICFYATIPIILPINAYTWITLAFIVCVFIITVRGNLMTSSRFQAVTRIEQTLMKINARTLLLKCMCLVVQVQNNCRANILIVK